MSATVEHPAAHPGPMLRLAWWSAVHTSRAVRGAAEVIVFLAKPMRHDHDPVKAYDDVVCRICAKRFDMQKMRWVR